MLVYLITNLVNSKRYVGITTGSVDARFKEHCCWTPSHRQKKSAIHEAIVKYGVDNFKVEQIDQAESMEELYKKEQFWIETLGTFQKEYNLTKGGVGSHGRILSEETIEKHRRSAIQTMSNPEIRLHLSRKTKEYFETHPEAKEHLRTIQLGKKLSPETIKKIADKQRGQKKNWSADGKQRMINAQKSRIRKPMAAELKETKKLAWLSNNPMNDPEKRKLVSQSKIGKKRFVRTDGSFYMADPANPIDPRTQQEKHND